MNIFSLLVFFIILSSPGAEDIIIKSLRVYSYGDETSMPIVYRGSDFSSSIEIEFDIQTNIQPNLKIVFKFCDRNWKSYSDLLFANQGFNTDYNLWYDLIPSSVGGARYHFRDKYPNEDVSFPFAGKWIFYITDSQDEKIVYGSGKFFVVEQEVKLSATIKKYSFEETILTPNSLNRRFDLRVNLQLTNNLHPSRVRGIEIIENKKIDYPIIIDREKNNSLRFYEWNGADRFSFTVRDIYPGNEYRQTDIKDKNRFAPPLANAQFDGIETSRFYRLGRYDMNGGSILTNFRDVYAEYMEVKFSIRPPENIAGQIFLVGSFNNWIVSPNFEMEENGGLYTTSVELKRGKYDYQYVIAESKDAASENLDWLFLEGNYWETDNIYFIFLYYDSPDLGGFDKIISFTKITSGDL